MTAEARAIGLVEAPAQPGDTVEVGDSALIDFVKARKMRVLAIELSAQCRQRIEGKLLAQNVGERAQDRPVLLGLARRETGPAGHLDASFRIDIGAGLFRIGGPRQDDVCAMRAGVAMRTNIDNEGVADGLHVEFVRAEQEEHVGVGEHLRGGLAALARNEADVEPANARRCRMKDAKAVPVLTHGIYGLREPGGLAEHRCPVGAGQRPLPHDDQRMARRLQRLEEIALAIGQRLQRLRPGAELLIVVAKVADFADHADRQIALPPALADARIEHGRLEARIGADDQHGVSLFDALDGGVEEVARAAESRIECGAVLPAVDVFGTERPDQLLQRVHFLDAG